MSSLLLVLVAAALMSQPTSAQRTAVLGDSLTVGMRSRLSALLGADLDTYEATVGDGTAAATSKINFDASVRRVIVGLG